jgi:hypothetical protein
MAETDFLVEPLVKMSGSLSEPDTLSLWGLDHADGELEPLFNLFSVRQRQQFAKKPTATATGVSSC